MSAQVPEEREPLDDPLYGCLTWIDLAPGGLWEGELDTPDGRSVRLSISAEAIEKARPLFTKITADLEGLHERLADEHLAGLNKRWWAHSPMTREQFLARIRLCSIDIDSDGSVYVEFDDSSEEDILSGHGIGFIFHPDGTSKASLNG